MNTKYPMKLVAPLKDYIWGGTKLKNEYNKSSDLDIVAESWELSCHENGQSVIENGIYKDKLLNEILKNNCDYLGEKANKFEKFPILIKLIDANDKLSVQVHPCDCYAKELENGEYGKTEVWYIIDAKPNAQLVYGFKKDVFKDEFQKAILEDTLPDILNFVNVKKGDVFFIPAGLIHAICDGIFICEIQQNSDTTYRVFDWGRINKDGTARPLHIKKALAVSKLTREIQTDFLPSTIEYDNYKYSKIAECAYFSCGKYEIINECMIKSYEDCFSSYTVINGDGYFLYNDSKYPFQKGDTYFIPANMGNFKIVGQCELIMATI